MKKFIAILLLLLFLCGCSSDKINSNDYEAIIDKFLSNNTKLVNTYEVGYKYYLPNDVGIVSSGNYNAKLISNGCTYYLYVDIVSYYYKTDLNFNINSDAFYSKNIDYNGKKGYIEIDKSDDLFKIVFYYNNACMEAYVDENNLSKTIINMCYILNSIVFNDTVISIDIGEDYIASKEEVFDFYTPRSGGNFIDYIELYDEYEDNTDNNIGNEEG